MFDIIAPKRRRDCKRAPAAGPVRAAKNEETGHECDQEVCPGLIPAFVSVDGAGGAAAAQQQQKPNILFIMGDDIGWMQPSIYHRGLMVGETPNIDRIGNEGAIFM